MHDGSQFPTPTGFRRDSAVEPRQRQGAPVRVVHSDPALAVTFTPLHPMTNDWYRIELGFPSEGVVEVLAHLVFAGERELWQRLPALERNHFSAQLRFDGLLERLDLLITGSGLLTQPDFCRIERVGIMSQLAAAARRGVEIARRDGFGVINSALNYLWRLTRPGAIVMSRGSASNIGEGAYETWTRVFDEAPERHRARHEARLARLAQRPLISVLAILEEADEEGADRLIRGLLAQVYPNWELVVAAPRALRERIGASDLPGAKLHLIERSIVESRNALLAEARGDYVFPVDGGTLLRPNALLEFALTLDRYPNAEVIYADDDRIDAEGSRSEPRFKPAWSSEFHQASDYIGSSALLRTASVRALRGWRDDVPEQQHDLMMRMGASAAADAIVHLAKVVVHHSAASAPLPSRWRRHPVPAPPPRVSLIIPTRDNAGMLEICIRSIRERTRYPNYEIVVIDNGSVEPVTHRLFERLAKDSNVRILPRPGPFNFSALNNSAVAEADGDIVGLLNNDVETTDEAWLDEMVALAALPDVGCVGARLLYPDGHLQHGGIILGLGGVAGHAHRFAPASEPGALNRLRVVHEVSAVTAACLLLRKSVFEAVGGLDEGLAVAFNDVDLCLKVRAAGYRNVWTPFATLVHHESLSRGRDVTPAKARRFADEYAAMQKRWGADLMSDPYYSPHLTYDREDFSPRVR